MQVYLTDILWSRKQGQYDCRVIGYDSIGKHLAECMMNTVTYKKEIQSF